VYGALTACVVGIYVIVVGYLGALFRTSGNLAISLIATALVAMLVQPLRAWLQRGANRLLYGDRDEPYAVVARLGQRLEAALAPELVVSIKNVQKHISSIFNKLQVADRAQAIIRACDAGMG
jgi:hypothetical protein